MRLEVSRFVDTLREGRVGKEKDLDGIGLNAIMYFKGVLNCKHVLCF